jgi:hypothetical protein
MQRISNKDFAYQPVSPRGYLLRLGAEDNVWELSSGLDFQRRKFVCLSR